MPFFLVLCGWPLSGFVPEPPLSERKRSSRPTQSLGSDLSRTTPTPPLLPPSRWLEHPLLHANTPIRHPSTPPLPPSSWLEHTTPSHMKAPPNQARSSRRRSERGADAPRRRAPLSRLHLLDHAALRPRQHGRRCISNADHDT